MRTYQYKELDKIVKAHMIQVANNLDTKNEAIAAAKLLLNKINYVRRAIPFDIPTRIDDTVKISSYVIIPADIKNHRPNKDNDIRWNICYPDKLKDVTPPRQTHLIKSIYSSSDADVIKFILKHVAVSSLDRDINYSKE